MFEINYYRLKDGTAPVEDFILSLDTSMMAKVLSGLAILKEFGNMTREPYSKYIDNGIFELRVKVSTNISRIFYFFQAGQQIILTNGYVKKTQKMDQREYERALAYKADFESRK